ncbi:hypothetical protein [Spirosoma pulveris]
MDITYYQIRRNSKQEIKDLFSVMNSYVLYNFEKYCLEILSIKSLPNLSDDVFIEYIFKSNFQALDKVRLTKNYYIYLLTINLNQIKKIINTNLDELEVYIEDNKEKPYLVLYDVISPYNRLLEDSMLILQEYTQYFPNSDHKPNWYSINIQNPHPDVVFQIAYKSLMGTLIDNADMRLDSPHHIQLLIRYSIELELRQASGTYAIINRKDNLYLPIGMDKIFNVLWIYKSDLPKTLPLKSFLLISKWCNLYTHSGFSDYFTKLHFASVYLKNYFNADRVKILDFELRQKIHATLIEKLIKNTNSIDDYSILERIPANLWGGKS